MCIKKVFWKNVHVLSAPIIAQKTSHRNLKFTYWRWDMVPKCAWFYCGRYDTSITIWSTPPPQTTFFGKRTLLTTTLKPFHNPTASYQPERAALCEALLPPWKINACTSTAFIYLKAGLDQTMLLVRIDIFIRTFTPTSLPSWHLHALRHPHSSPSTLLLLPLMSSWLLFMPVPGNTPSKCSSTAIRPLIVPS